MLTVNIWDKDTDYEANTVVLFYNKLYVSAVDNSGIIPIPFIDYDSVIVDDNTLELSAGNKEALLIIAKSIYPDLDDSALLGHLNNKDYWRILQ